MPLAERNMVLNRRHYRRAGDVSASGKGLPLNAAAGNGEPVSKRSLGVFSNIVLLTRSMPMGALAFLVISCLAAVYVAAIRPLSILLFGPKGSPIGGLLGIFVDSQLRQYLFRKAATDWEQELRAHGIRLPPPPPTSSNAKLKTLPNFALGSILLQMGKGREVVDLSSTASSFARVRVDVTDIGSPPEAIRWVPKVSIQDHMRERSPSCEPNWFCFRCLKAPNLGTYERCSFLCGTCSRELICTSPRLPAQSYYSVELRLAKEVGGSPTAGLIPRIIHQTWFEDLSPMKHPQLVRLQNSWKNSGWDYRFYDDKAVEEYVDDHFPPPFLSAFQSIVPGAYKADFFRYLVLMKDGGIYADIDVMLDANLDNFISPTMGFFVPRDTVGEQVRENFCLWNGFIGAAPGHPFMIKTVERMMNLVLNRADLYDMEQHICRNERHQGQTWKSRIEPNLLLTGPCALGVSVNEVMSKDPVANFGVGWVQKDAGTAGGKIPGEVMVLALDKNDLGALRMTDVERNTIVASTDMPGLTKTPLNVRSTTAGSRAVGNQRPPHYSFAGKGDHIWGTKFVYSDALAANMKFEMLVVEEFTNEF